MALFGWSIPTYYDVFVANGTESTVNGFCENEVIVLNSANDILKCTGIGNIINSTIRVTDGIASGNDGIAFLNYDGRAAPGELNLSGSLVLIEAQGGRANMQVNDLISTKVTEAGTRQTFLYTKAGADISDVVIDGINTWEIVGAPNIASGITIKNCNYGYLNWEAGRLDFLRFKVENIQISHSWIGTGASNNDCWHWDNDISFDETLLRIDSATANCYFGTTQTLKVTDVNGAINNAVVTLYDDFGSPGNLSTVTSWTTNTEGHCHGVYDSQNRVNGPSLERSTIFTLQRHTDQNGSDYSSGGGRSYSLTDVDTRITIRHYNYIESTEFSIGNTMIADSTRGYIAEDYSPSVYYSVILSADPYITQQFSSVVDGYTEVNTLDDLYDVVKNNYVKPMTSSTIIKANASGVTLVLEGNIIIDDQAASVYTQTYNAGTYTHVIKSSALGLGTIFKRLLTTTGTISLQNGGGINVPYIDINGSSSLITVDGGFNFSLVIQNSQGAVYGPYLNISSQNFVVDINETYRIGLCAFGKKTRVVNITGLELISNSVFYMNDDPVIDQSIEQTTLDTISGYLSSTISSGDVILFINESLDSYNAVDVLAALQYWLFLNGDDYLLALVFYNAEDLLVFNVGSVKVNSSKFFLQVGTAYGDTKAVPEDGVFIPLVIEGPTPGELPLRKNSNNVVLNYARWVQSKSVISVSDRSYLNNRFRIINEGISKSSLLIPHLKDF